MAFPIDWGRVLRIPVNTDLLADSDRTNIPFFINEDVLTVGAGSNEIFDADGSNFALNGGGDLRFSSDAAGTTQLPCEVVSFVTDNDPSNGTCEIYVLIPVTTTTIYLWYNKSGETQPASNTTYGSEAVWIDYDFVSHDGGKTDASGNATPSASGGVDSGATGKFGEGSDFDGSDDYYDLGSILDYGKNDSFTVSLWAEMDSVPSVFRWFIGRENGTTGVGWSLRNAGTGYREKLDLLMTSSSGNSIYTYSNADLLSDTNWHQIGGRYDGTGSGGLSVFQDGDIKDSTDVASGTFVDTAATANASIGERITGSGNIDGVMDEIRVMPTALSDDDIALEYDQQINPTNYIRSNYPIAGSVLLADTGYYTDLYVRPAGSTYGDANGHSYTDAWAGWADVDWDYVVDGATITDSSNESFQVIGKTFWEPLTIDGDDSTIDGTTTVNNANWANVSGNIHRVQITQRNIDDFANVAPTSPTGGDLWYKTSFEGHGSDANVPMAPWGRVYEYDSANSEWRDSADGFLQPWMMWVDGHRTYPVITDGGAPSAIDTTNALSLTDATYGSKGDDYWNGNFASVLSRSWVWELVYIKDSTDAGQILFDELRFIPGVAASCSSYIIGNIGELTTEGEWAFDNDQYLYVYSVDPTAHVWEYSDNGPGIFIYDCANIQITNYTIKRTNDSAILISKSPGIEADHNNISDIWPMSGELWGGAIHCMGESADTDLADIDNLTGVNIHHNQIQTVYNGCGISVTSYDDFKIKSNRILNIGDPTRITNSPTGIAIIASETGGDIDSNYIRYCMYCGIYGWYLSHSTITNNVISHAMENFSDGGLLRLFARTDDREKECNYNTIQYNRFEWTADKPSVTGVYIDNGARYNTVDSNYFYAICGLTPDTYDSFGAMFEHSNAGASGNNATNNLIYDDDCTLVKNSSGDTWTGTVSGNTRYDETTYPYRGATNSSGVPLMMG